MSSTWMPRFVGQPKENDIKFKRTGDLRLLNICLGYAGTSNQLSCLEDGKRIEALALSRKVKDYVKLYDNGTTPMPSAKNVAGELGAMCKRCQPGDFMIVYYSGHGTQVEDESGDQESGMDQALCLRNENGQDETMIDDQLSEIISANLPNEIPMLFMVDACHSGTMLDLHKPIWKGKKVFCLSGCQDYQTSGDTGNGGIMTNSLLQILRDEPTLALRKKNAVSIQCIFNKTTDLVQSMSAGQQKALNQEDYELYDEEECEGFESDQGEFQGFGQEEDYEDYVQEHQEGQWLNLSWNGGTDPTKVPFPL